ncbi:MAG: hypothetical protein JNL70_00490 [Saprospiraceae bacterium]|nr:hypothetical protein [Saprospiraceae bacterium]
MRVFTCFFLILLHLSAQSQDILDIDGVPCPMEGFAKRQNDKSLNQLKNRYSFPRSSDFDPKFNWETLSVFEDDSRKFDVKKAAILRGYVLRVKMSEKETCNCNSENPEFRDTHIIITPDKNKRGVLDQIIVEITPRMRLIMKAKGVDWSQAALKKLYGKTIEVEGWLFYDYKHGDQSAKVMQKTKGVTRSTAWEIHPVTSIKVL